MLPHGPRPTTIPRRRRARPREAPAAQARPIANGAAAVRGPASSAGDADASAAKLPPTTPANAGEGPRRQRGGEPPAGGEERGVRDVRREGPHEEEPGDDVEVVGRGGHVGGPPGGGAAARQAIAAPPGGGPAGRATVMPCRTLRTRPQLPQVGTWARRSTRHIGQTTARSSPSSERAVPDG